MNHKLSFSFKKYFYIEFHYFGEEEGPDENADIDDQIETEPR